MAITVQEAQVVFSADGLNQVRSQARDAGQALDRATTKAGIFRRALTGIRAGFGGLSSAIGSAGGMLAALGAGAAAGGMLKLAAGAEQTAIAFEVMLGSASAAKQMIADMRQLDLKSAFGFQDLADSGRLMLNFGVAAGDVVPMLSVLGDIASGDSEKLHRLALAFGQSTAAGRLMGQDLLQMVNAGFNPLQEISRLTGESMLSLKKRMEAGGISIQEVQAAFVAATEKGGRFYGMNERMSQTTAGQFMKLRGQVEQLAIEIGRELLPVANDLLRWASSFIEGMKGIGTSVSTFVMNARAWFQSVRDNIADMGVVAGVVVVRIGDVFRDLWDNIRSHASAFFEWMKASLEVLAHNATAATTNAWKIATGKTKEKRTMIDDWGNEVEMEMSTLMHQNPMPAFNAPAPAGNAQNRTPLGQAIMDELETQRRLRQEARNAANQGGAMAGQEPKGLENNRQRGVVPAMRTGESRTFSAEALFASLRENTLNRTLNVAQQSLDVQHQQLIAQNNIANGINNLNLGLV